MRMSKLTGVDLENRFSYEFEFWKNTIGFDPVELIVSVDKAGAYEKKELHVFKLKRGYAIVTEDGCSCYESNDASIDILGSMKAVKESLSNLAKEEYGIGECAKDALLKLMGFLK